MTTCLGKSCQFGLLCVSFVNVYQFVRVVPSVFLVLRVGCGIILILVPDHCLFLFTFPTINLYYKKQI